jgi:hypothetical protein
MDGINQSILDEISTLLTNAWKTQLEIPRLSTRYGGPGIPGAPKKGVSPPIASGRLIREIGVKFVNNPDTGLPEAQLVMPIEGQFVSEGRRPGRYPPIAPIDKWVIQKKGLTGARDLKGKFIKRKSLVYLIRRSIGLYGYGGNDFIIKGYNEVAPQILELYGEYVAGFVQFEIDQLIDNLLKRND